MIARLITTHLELISEIVIPKFKRYLYSEIEWDSRLLIVLGARGTGKTTMLLQYYQEKYDNPQDCLYLLGDDGNVLNQSLSEIAREFYIQGGKTLIIDEIQKYPNWSREIKNIYDKHPKLKLIISGSSNISIIKEKYDLSRRAVVYHLPGMSFREYLNLELDLKLEKCLLEELLTDHQTLCQNLKKTMEGKKYKILQLFKSYLQHGYYPYYRESIKTYPLKLSNALNKILYEDIPSTYKVTSESVVNMKKILYLVGASHPFQVKITSLSKNLGISRNSVYEYLDYLNQADLLLNVFKTGGISRTMRKPQKLFLNNPNLYHVIGSKFDFEGEIGTIRETFTVNQLSNEYQVRVAEKGDFLVENQYCFEIGGQNKDFSQIKDVKNGYVFADDIEFGYGRKIPLYLLGFLY